ncbi:MAG: hypothetical protein ACQESK_08430 [Bacteroidota bacterium]
MASIKDLKKDLNYAFSEIIEGSMIQQIASSEDKSKKADELIEESIRSYDEFITEINKNVDDRKTHLKNVQKEIEAKLNEMVEKLNNL